MAGRTPYVVGFAIDDERESVLLVRKNRPAWMAGKLNGVGGHVEPGEAPIAAMVREFEEETGVETRSADWRLFARLATPVSDVRCFVARRQKGEDGIDIWRARTTTDEIVMELDLRDVVAGRHRLSHNVPWLLHLAMRAPDLAAPVHVQCLTEEG